MFFCIFCHYVHSTIPTSWLLSFGFYLEIWRFPLYPNSCQQLNSFRNCFFINSIFSSLSTTLFTCSTVSMTGFTFHLQFYVCITKCFDHTEENTFKGNATYTLWGSVCEWIVLCCFIWRKSNLKSWLTLFTKWNLLCLSA